ncbi:4-alpha-glucanotransferase [Serinibacter salmoneus]|uniref:4-alpha-glucanotransferase n=1 Tax=Serinibacter salmoneus TaxID=556530 RepID=A0A2A9D0N8_9MICO|nr:4-alpha-glucanotransferase [Serinibacter salmoneus]PFG19946.1 4-alpha-glucanotransferase [Serinibacter salmoneus]
MSSLDSAPAPELVALAEGYGIATQYHSFFGDLVQVPETTLRRILEAMGVATFTAEQVERERAELAARPWRELVPPSLVVRQGDSVSVPVTTREGRSPVLELVLEDGTRRPLPVPSDLPAQEQEVEGVPFRRVTLTLPGDLPLGWHTVEATETRTGESAPARAASCVLAVVPQRLEMPELRPDKGGRGWGLMTQLYSVRSRASWGIGDFADLADIADLTGTRGGDFVLVNPVHAGEVTGHIEPSPYLPASRRFVSPLYIRPEDIAEAAYLPSSQRALVEWAQESVAASNTDARHLDRDASWAAKRSALEVIFQAPRSARRQRSFEAFRAREGRVLEDFALWCAIQEHYEGPDGAAVPDGSAGPAELDDATSPLVSRLRSELASRVEFYSWIQWVADEQLERAQRAGLEAGMSLGVMHDLAVGVHPQGADAWSMRRFFAPGISVGAPPDMYNQQGQDWSQPPWRPEELRRSGYRPLREMVRALLRHAGALRIDHIIGFFRLWWIPQGLGAGAGTYVRYDHEAMIGVLLLEAQRAGAVVIGEDLGNVEPWVRDYLSSRGVLGTSVLWFEYEGDQPKPPEHYRKLLLATVNTHDLPPTAGYLADEHVDLRERLGLLTEPVEQVRAAADHERERILGILRERGLISAHPTEREIVEALHLHLVAAESVLLGVALVDAVGERRTQNQPGTFEEYPNWQVPLANSSEEAVLVEDLAGVSRFESLTSVIDGALRAQAAERA